MKKKTFLSLINYCKKLFKNNKIYYGHSSYDALSESINLIYSILNININKKYKKINNFIVNNKKSKKIIKLAYKRIKKKIPISYLTNNT